jgi:hypothetical protein
MVGSSNGSINMMLLLKNSKEVSGNVGLIGITTKLLQVMKVKCSVGTIVRRKSVEMLYSLASPQSFFK